MLSSMGFGFLTIEQLSVSPFKGDQIYKDISVDADEFCNLKIWLGAWVWFVDKVLWKSISNMITVVTDIVVLMGARGSI
jgi:uncharacterized membrane protein YccF (DUF307 family)